MNICLIIKFVYKIFGQKKKIDGWQIQKNLELHLVQSN